MTCRKYKLLFFSLAIASLFILAPDINAGQASILNTSQTKNTLVKGTVKDVSGEPLIGVSVSVKGKSGIGTITDINGNFSIQCDANDILVFSYIGYATLEFPVNGKSSLSISMKEDTKVLDEVRSYCSRIWHNNP